MLITSGHCRSRPNEPFEPQHLAWLSDQDSKKTMHLHVVARCVCDAAVARASLGHRPLELGDRLKDATCWLQGRAWRQVAFRLAL